MKRQRARLSDEITRLEAAKRANSLCYVLPGRLVLPKEGIWLLESRHAFAPKGAPIRMCLNVCLTIKQLRAKTRERTMTTSTTTHSIILQQPGKGEGFTLA